MVSAAQLACPKADYFDLRNSVAVAESVASNADYAMKRRSPP